MTTNNVKKKVAVAITIISCVADCSRPANIDYNPYKTVMSDAIHSNQNNNARIKSFVNAYTPYIISCINGVEKKENDFMNTYNLNFNKLKVMSNLEENWDDEGAMTFSAELIEKVKSLLLHLNPYQPDIFPKNDSRIQLEFFSKDNRFLKIILSEKSFDVYSTDNFNYKNDFFDTFELNEKKIYDIVSQFYKNKLVSEAKPND